MLYDSTEVSKVSKVSEVSKVVQLIETESGKIVAKSCVGRRGISV